MTYDVSTGYGLTSCIFCNSADYYKIVEATENVLGSRKIVGTFCIFCNSADYYKIVEATENVLGSRKIVGTS